MFGVCGTAQFTAAARAKESQNFDRLFYDPYAELFAQERGFEMLQHFSKYRKLLGDSEGVEETVLICALRTRYFDDIIYNSLERDNEINQIVILGCGFDTRSFRLFPDSPDRELIFYEVDFEPVIQFRENILPVKTIDNILRYPIIADVTDAEFWERKLKQNNFNPNKKTIWVLEGLLMYIDEEKVHHLLRKICQLSPAGSVILGDTYNVASIHSILVKNYNEDWAKWGAPFVWGTDDPESLLIKHGFSTDIVISKYGDENVSYGRFPPNLNLLLQMTQNSNSAPKTFLFTAVRDGKAEKELWDWIGFFKIAAAKKQLAVLADVVKNSKLDKIANALDYFLELTDQRMSNTLEKEEVFSSDNIIIDTPVEEEFENLVEDLD